MGALVSGKVYRLTLHTMTTKSNNDGGNGGVYYAGEYMDNFDYELGNSSRRIKINSITHDAWGETYIYFVGPTGSSDLNLTI
jgi:hypothetical protein